MKPKTRNKTKAFLRTARWLLVQTTDYVSLTHSSEVHASSVDPYHNELVAASNTVRLPPYPDQKVNMFRHTDEDGTEYVTAGKNGQRLTPEEVERRLAKAREKYDRDRARYDRARAKQAKVIEQTRKRLNAEARKDPAGMRFSYGPGNPVLGRNLAKRAKVMRRMDADSLARIDQQLVQLQRKRTDLLYRAWSRAHDVTPQDLLTLSDLSGTATKRSQRTRDIRGRDLDHRDTVWPPKPKQEEAAA